MSDWEMVTMYCDADLKPFMQYPNVYARLKEFVARYCSQADMQEWELIVSSNPTELAQLEQRYREQKKYLPTANWYLDVLKLAVGSVVGAILTTLVLKKMNKK